MNNGKLILPLAALVFILAPQIIHAQYSGWISFRIPTVLEFKIPPCVELQGGLYKEIKDAVMKQGYFKIPSQMAGGNKAVAIFQQVGLNDFIPTAQETYARILVYYEKGEDSGIGPFFSNTEMPSSDLAVIDAMMKEQSLSDFHSLGMTMVKWFGTHLVQRKGCTTIVTSYLRRLGDNKPVYVEQNIMILGQLNARIVLSCREDEKSTSFADIWKVMDTVVLLK